MQKLLLQNGHSKLLDNLVEDKHILLSSCAHHWYQQVFQGSVLTFLYFGVLFFCFWISHSVCTSLYRISGLSTHFWASYPLSGTVFLGLVLTLFLGLVLTFWYSISSFSTHFLVLHFWV